MHGYETRRLRSGDTLYTVDITAPEWRHIISCRTPYTHSKLRSPDIHAWYSVSPSQCMRPPACPCRSIIHAIKSVHG